MPDTAWPISRHPPGSSQGSKASPVSMSPESFDTSSVVRLRSPSCSTPAALKRDFSATLTTTALDRSSSRWFAASTCTATAEGHQATTPGSSISCTAPHPVIWSLHPASFNVRVHTFGRPIKVKGPGRDFGHKFRGRISRGWLSEGRRSLPVASVSAGRWSTGTIRPVFGCAGSAPAAAGVLVVGVFGCSLRGGREPMTCRSAGVWGSWACRATCPSRALIYARPGVTLAPTSAGPAGLALSGLAACQSETIRL